MIPDRKNPYVIAEAGVNHNGSMKMALELVKTAKEAGADAVKFQTFRAHELATKAAPKADYQVENSRGSNDSQFEMLKKLELTDAQHFELAHHCEKLGIQFLSTPFDRESLKFLVTEFDLPMIKVGSGDLTNWPLLHDVAVFQKSVILSTGMATLDEIEGALGVLAFGYLKSGKEPSLENFKWAYASSDGKRILRENLTLLHCTTEYPAPFGELNLSAMKTLADRFGVRVGYSDHSKGIEAAVAATALGACLIEKHFTLDRTLDGPDHKASLVPAELHEMIRSVRNIGIAVGNGHKEPAGSELKNRVIARKGIVASRPIAYGEPFTEKNITVKRPEKGLAPCFFWNCLGQKAKRNFQADEAIELSEED